ncbi:hypothetical protein HanXRQr2_Chr03g0104721 [Helianthus annuus]|uniref:Uncharacterized protein n=1 Tax=Helianthus annuus TaxID=4232 RepID=A0A9K3JE35_HELAN|nr:hypothetical protein HanXRQr2_Chr03g0104721 [Helianthus annuus]KAJ0592625.1 hypothetical protein HanHA300_Chr03g0087301 [Helianthus annuus]KAJ0600236.1 hypothetical protein HanIR_Chr03g0114281 [Helianthus annuus]KAJ0607621.1 hypothetical protein HanHA89_Chr03g0098881 [Helianthus annuus]KAJ0767685.1 hypothetical protein HanLR1_Chr03g0092241 [Helianthus annuus]
MAVSVLFDNRFRLVSGLCHIHQAHQWFRVRFWMNSIYVSGPGFRFNMLWFGSRFGFGQHKSTAVNSANESQPVNCWSTVEPRLG